MILLLQPAASAADVERVLGRLRELELAGAPLAVGPMRLVHVTSGDTRRARRLVSDPLVQAVVPTSGPRVRREGRRFWPYHALCTAAVSLVLLGVLVLLAGFLPPGVSGTIAPGEAAPAARWPWYLAPARGLLARVPHEPAWLGPSLLVALGALFLALPALDRARGEGLHARLAVLALGLLALGLAVALGLAGGSA